MVAGGQAPTMDRHTGWPDAILEFPFRVAKNERKADR
jgi:hypothetical protein